MNKTLIALTLTTLVTMLIANPALADRLESDSYIIQFGNFNIAAGEKSSASYTLTDTVGQTGNGPYGSYGSSSFFVGGGFQYIYQINSFGFTISDVSLDLGSLAVDTHSTAANNLTITTRGAGGYTVFAYKLHEFRHSDGSTTIADTICDSGACTHTAAAIWINQSVAGFGFNSDGDDTPSDFIDSTYFRQFADDSTVMQAVMNSASIAESRQTTITYKAGIASSQTSGNYQTGIIYVAVPGY